MVRCQRFSRSNFRVIVAFGVNSVSLFMLVFISFIHKEKKHLPEVILLTCDA